MLQGKELILATKPFAKENRRKSWLSAVSTFFLLLGLLTVILIVPYFSIKLISSFLAGLVIVRMFVIYHDYEHHTILQHSWWAKFMMASFGIYILAPESIWKRSHDYHHQHNSKLYSSSIGSYPVVHKKKYLSMSPSEKRTYLAVRHPLNILFAYFTMFIYGMCIASFTSCLRRHWDSLLAVTLHISISVLVILFLGWKIWLTFLFIPFFISTAIGAYLFYAQHNFPGVVFCVNNDWTYEKAALESSSYMIMNPLMAWVTANIGYHHIHHLNARIPFYRLPEVMHNFPELQTAKTTSFSLKGIRDCLRLKVWDPEQNRMIGMKEIRSSAFCNNSAAIS
jgi:acyl-lipid omega-6 desaturase (Delta-12 desaturase)